MTTNGRDFGRIVYLNERGGYGFVRPDAAERDVFFHVSAIAEEVRIGDNVSFEIATDSTGRRCARNVRTVNGDAQEVVEEEREQAESSYARDEGKPTTTALAEGLARKM